LSLLSVEICFNNEGSRNKQDINQRAILFRPLLQLIRDQSLQSNKGENAQQLQSSARYKMNERVQHPITQIADSTGVSPHLARITISYHHSKS
jgi:hypothetical protein